MIDVVTVEKDNILGEVSTLKLQGYRLAAITCDKEGENLELTYHFDLNYEMKNLRILVEPTAAVKSISSIFPSAMLIENEFQDLYGLTFEGLTIDYKGRLYLAENAPKAPMLNK